VTGRYLLDNSAWSRLFHPALPLDRRSEVAEAIRSDRVYVCLPFLLEAGYSARNLDDYRDITRALHGLPNASVDEAVEARAIHMQGDLVACGHHRLPPADLLIAAIAERHGLTVLHCDSDFDVIRDKTSAVLSAEWLAPPATFS
jgi:predicted nucleic acid-binding protein